MKLVFVSLSTALLLLTGCIEPNQVFEPPAPASGRFSTQIKPIMDRSCGGSSCHGGGPSGFAGGLDLTSWEAMFRGSRYGTVIVPGSPFMSHLVQTVNWTDTTISPISSVRMPASRDQISTAEIDTLVQWIRTGARNDVGEIAFPEPRPLGKVFFTSQFVDLVGVLDIQTGLIMRYVTAGHPLPFSQPPEAPHNVQIDDQGRYYYVTLISANFLRKYDAVTNELVGEAAVGQSPAHVVITADGSKAYVTNFAQGIGQVYVVNTASMTVERVITHPLMNKTHGARLSHDGVYLYIGNNASDLLTIIRTANDSIVANLHVSNGLPSPGSFVYKPYQVAVRNDDRFIYISCNGAVTTDGRGVVSVFERNGDTFTFVRLIPVGVNPLQLEVTRDQRYVYVCNRGSASVSVISADSNAFYTTIEDVGKQPHGIDITEDSRTAYVTCENVLGSEPPHHPVTGSKTPAFIAIIDVNDHQVIRRIEVGGFAAGVSIYPGRGN